ncbi:MAG: biotin--[acetyl-CoA-carboxylase] ligase [Syntrophales bacterium]|jgi:BirA family biotin operon repressor/biotin-[acetyl-CoA-carboxylase] ligase|nr:biotin--[acetyl-CoA-carboxylase] ligase [Syntrophales bacterium]MDY0043540.1 biotin--[acetyl-CoA-carboxylase] ligase [Syntrophales bacterium]
MHDLFNAGEIAKHLSGTLVGRNITFFDEIDSTNTRAIQLAAQGAREGDVVIAESQTGGRGRLRGRRWQSPPNVNLYASIILRPKIAPSIASTMTLMAGVAVADVLSGYCPGDVCLKWPNDVLIKMKKVCGILTEMKAKKEAIEYVIIGIGININMRSNEFMEEFRAGSTSLSAETGNEITRSEVAAKVFNSLDAWYQTYLSQGFDNVREKWLRYAGILGRHVEVKGKSTIERGMVLGIDEEGALLLERGDSEILKILSGDVYIGEGE